MARYRPMLRSFNGGEFSDIMAGRTDMNRYGSSMKRLRNSVALPQGPAIRRSGTRMIVPVYDETKACWTLPFVFSIEQASTLEFQSGRIRFISDNGLLTYAPAAATASVFGGALRVSSADITSHDAQIGDTIVLDGFTAASGLNSRVVKIVDVSGDDYTTDFALASVAGLTVSPTVAVAYTVDQPFDDVDLPNLRAVQLLDRVYLLCEGYRTRKIERFGVYDWRVSVVQFIDGPYEPNIISGITLTPDGFGPNAIIWQASDVTGINRDQGFLATDVNRLVRVRDTATTNGKWWWFKITQVLGVKRVKGNMQALPGKTAAALATLDPVSDIRLGRFSDTTGWPTVGRFIQDRFWLANTTDQPDLVCASFVGGYENFQQSDPDGTVNPDNAIVFPLNGDTVAPVQWIRARGKKTVVIGTQTGPWVMQPSDTENSLSALNPSADRATSRGAAFIDPVEADSGLLFVDRTKKVLRECVYNFQADGFVTPPMSLYASHLGSPDFNQVAFLGEPHSIAMLKRGDGQVAGFTYNREEDVLGWHLHDFNGVVETAISLPSVDGQYETLWITVARNVGGVTRRFHERLEPFWSFESSLDTAWYVDCGLRYEGAPAQVFYVPHLAGATVHGLSDGSPIKPVVADPVTGRIALEGPGANIVLGLGFDSIGETNNLEVQTETGTAQGKQKRVEQAKLRLWQSGGGFVGAGASLLDLLEEDLQELPGRRAEDALDAPVPLRTYDTEPIIWPGDFVGDTTIVFKQPKEIPLPFNVVAIIPTLQVN